MRHHGASLDAFRAAGGLRLLAAALGDGWLRAKRKALQLLREVGPTASSPHGAARLSFSRRALLVHHQPGTQGAVLLETARVEVHVISPLGKDEGSEALTWLAHPAPLRPEDAARSVVNLCHDTVPICTSFTLHVMPRA